ncbi:MAG: hypothetical protein H7287_13760 [Thermoleophilia bacterium]|nr:hypothetical protein [Thermoleophilia bacterium]
MTSTYFLIPVAFLRSVGGLFSILLAVDEGDAQLFDGEPALLVVHRPGAPAEALQVEGAEALIPAAVEVVASVATELVNLIEAAFTSAGEFDGERLLGARIAIDAPTGSFALRGDA